LPCDTSTFIILGMSHTAQEFFSVCADITDHKICGMYVDCAEYIRAHRNDERELSNMIDAVQNCVDPTISLGVFIGPVVGKQWACRLSTDIKNLDVIICLLSDITNIDSKQVTFISNRLPAEEKDKLWDALYKKNFLA